MNTRKVILLGLLLVVLLAGCEYGFQTGLFDSIVQTYLTENPDSYPPAAPTDLAAVSVNWDTIELSWTDNSPNEQRFQIQRRLAGSVTGVDVYQASARLAAADRRRGDFMGRHRQVGRHFFGGHVPRGSDGYDQLVHALTPCWRICAQPRAAGPQTDPGGQR